MQALLQDLRFALRQLRRTPGFVLTAVLTLALGIGANTAIFSLLDQALLRSLPVHDSRELVILSSSTDTWNGRSSSFGGDIRTYFSYPMYRDLRDKAPGFQGLAATAQVQGDVSIVANDHPEIDRAEIVSGNYFTLLGVQPAAGRLFAPADDNAPGASPLVVLSAAYWQSHFGGARSVVGKAISLNGHPFQVIGVTDPGFQSAVWGQLPDVFLPMSMLEVAMPGSGDRLKNHSDRWLNIFGRLQANETPQTAQTAVAPLWHALRADELKASGQSSPRFVAGFLTDSHLLVLPGAQGLSYSRDTLKTPLMAVMGMAVLVLLISTVNVASLLMVRSAGRVREFSLRFALGANGRRILQQLLLEGLLLGLLGALVGLLLAPLALHTLVARLADSNGTTAFAPTLNLPLLGFTLLAALVVSVLFSIVPAWQLRHPDLASSLKQQSGTASGAALGLRRLIVGLQVGLSVLLLVAAGLFVRTMRNLRTVNPGFNVDHLITFSVDPQLAGYKAADVNPLQQRLMQAMAAIPGVTAVAGTTDAELAGNSSYSNITVQGYNNGPEEDMNVELAAITPGYFDTLQLPLLTGRDFQLSDNASHPLVVTVNEAFVRRFLGGDPQRALGRRIARGAGDNLSFATVVGVFRDAHHQTLRIKPAPTLLVPVAQYGGPLPLNFYVRTRRSTADALAALRNTTQTIAPGVALSGALSMNTQIDQTLRNESLIELLAIAFGLLAVTLSGVGLYGVLAYSTAQRTREIGVRMALGATRLGVSGLVVKDVLKLAGLGTLLALPCAVLLGRLLQSQLYGVSSADPLTLLAVVVLITLVALLAALLPARRASSIDPMRALRSE